MATNTELGARTSAEEPAGNLLIQASSPDQGADSDATKKRIRSPQQDRSVLEQLLHNLMLTLGALPI